MRPRFNTTGPCYPDEHYMLPPERRLGRIMELIDDGRYFSLHAGRQTGKTTSAQWLTDHYNAGKQYCALWFDERVPRPLVVFFDEADCLVSASMVSFLTQLRGGYLSRRKAPFPHSIVLIGQRNIRDYVMSQEERIAVSWLGSASPFNIAAEATSIAAFTEPEVMELLTQHTTVTGQRFQPDAVARIYELSQGHPWLVNALADQITDRDVRDRSVAIIAAHVDAAKETIILERRTHIDSLIHKLRDPRVCKILEPMLVGEVLPSDVLDDDVAYVLGLGIIRVVRGEYVIANPIYREVFPRALTWVRQHSIHQLTEWYLRPDGS